MDLIRLENIEKIYHLGEVDVPALQGVSLTVRQGELVALMGASGSGKTTLMNILGCLDRPSAGHYWLDGAEISSLDANERAAVRNEKIGFVFQNFNLLARTSAWDNVAMPLEYSPHHLSDGDSAQRARQLLERVGLSHRLDHEPSQMSGGQQQRVAIARALVNRPPLILADEPTGNLDSTTSGEILEMFQQLNAMGITIVLVTHNPDVAAHAQRVIHVRDGCIVQEESGHGSTSAPVVVPSAASGQSDPPAEAGPQLAPAAPTAPPPPRVRRTWLHLAPRSLRTALRSLRRNIMRSALTTLGIVIGVAAVITMMEIGQGSKKSLEKIISSMGANNLLVQAGAAASGGISFGSGSVLTLTPDDARQIVCQCPAVEGVAPLVRTRAQVIRGNRNWVPMYIYGTTPDYLQVRDWEPLQEGEPFTDADVRNQTKVCLIGTTLVRELFGGESPIGNEIRIQNIQFKVVGVLTRKGANMMGLDQDDIVLAPWTTIKYRVSAQSVANVNQSSQGEKADASQQVNSLSDLYPGTTALYPEASITQKADTPQPIRVVNVDQILVKAASTEEIPRAIEQITVLLREQHHLRRGQPDDFNIRNMTEMTRTLSATSGLMASLLLSVALISLVVGGVGIMNVMLVTVTERTREIGLRMAVGASSRKILQQFLLEAVVLCLLGGAAGIALGKLVSMLVTHLLHWNTESSMPAIIASVAVSATVGIVFGYYPAWKASRLDPIEALRYE